VQHVRLEATQTLAQVAQVRARAEAASRVHAENSRARAEAARAKADAAAKHARRRSAVLARLVRQTKRKQREQQALRKTTLEMEDRHDEPRATQRQHGNGKVGGGGRAAGKYAARYAKAEKMAHKMKHRHQKHGRCRDAPAGAPPEGNAKEVTRCRRRVTTAASRDDSVVHRNGSGGAHHLGTEASRRVS
jgi:hypothetical protein